MFVMKSAACDILTLVESLELHFKKKFPKTFMGIRPGEKMHETLCTSDEVSRSLVEREDGIVYARIPPLDKNLGDFYFSSGYSYCI